MTRNVRNADKAVTYSAVIFGEFPATGACPSAHSAADKRAGHPKATGRRVASSTSSGRRQPEEIADDLRIVRPIELIEAVTVDGDLALREDDVLRMIDGDHLIADQCQAGVASAEPHRAGGQRSADASRPHVGDV